MLNFQQKENSMENFHSIFRQCPLFDGIEMENLSAMMGCIGGRQISASKGQYISREGDSATSLMLALFLLLLQNPYCAVSVGLLLSFGAVAGILLFASPISQSISKPLCFADTDPLWKRMSNRAVRAVSAVIGTSVGAMVFTVPVVVFCFGKISLISPVSNLLCLLAVSVAYIGGAVAAGIGLLWPAAALCWPA
jgi:competence protein ComEC